jgi:RND family efflux transporter MFP subunit
MRAQALVNSRKAAVRTAKDRLQARQATESYLRVTAPFDGIITDRFVNPGMLIDGGRTPMLKLQQVSHLRLIVPVPETYTNSVAKGMSAVFHVPARPGRSYTAKVARIPNALDQQSRAMMVELDVYNKDGSLAPGMYPTVDWPVGAGRIFCLFPRPASSRRLNELSLLLKSMGKHAGSMCGRAPLLVRTFPFEVKSLSASR